MEYRDIGENIRKYRNRLDLTQEQLADRIGVTWEMVSRYERGENSPMNKLEKIATALNIPITDLINDSLANNYEVPLFIKIPKNFLFTNENTTLFYSCPKWLAKRDPQVFVVNSNIVQNNDLISEGVGYIFISPNSEIQTDDLVLTKNKGKLSIKRFKQQNASNIGKIMMQEIIFS
jgi:transcriptional regulator with XRE-family HTH domain